MQLSITLVIIIITTLVSIGGFSSPKIIDDLIFYPPAVTEQRQWWRFFTCGFIHADFGHLILNMFVLYLFGLKVEKTFIEIFGRNGSILYLVMYISALVVCLLPTFKKHRHNYYYRSLGASGAVSAVVFAGILFDPISGIGLFFIPIYIAGFLFAIIYLLFSYWLDKKGAGNINHSAHIFGALYGVAFTLVASRIFSDFPLLTYFIDRIKNMDPGQIIQFGHY